MNERDVSIRRDGVGVLLFAFGAFFAVLLLRAFASDVPPEEAGQLGALASLWIDSIGGIAGLVLMAGIAFVGARVFLAGASEGLLRHLGGLALVAIGVSIVAGAFAAQAGGAIGRAIGASLANVAHSAVGALVGLGIALAAIWFTWVRGSELAQERETRSAPPKGAGESDGVTLAEAAALIPVEDFPQSPERGRKRSAPADWPAPTSPYPEDVRLRGEIPAGARPLEAPHAQAISSGAAPSSVYRWTAPRVDEPSDGAGADLARSDERQSHSDDALDDMSAELLGTDEGIEALPEPIAEIMSAGLIEDEEVIAVAIDPRAGRHAHESVARPIESGARAIEAPPRPSWEQSNLFEGVVEEPVDAYGTPLSLVESILEAAPEPANELATQASTVADAALESAVFASVAPITDVEELLDEVEAEVTAGDDDDIDFDDDDDDDDVDDDEDEDEDEDEEDDEEEEDDEDDADDDEEEEIDIDDELAEGDVEEQEEIEEEVYAATGARDVAVEREALAVGQALDVTEVELTDVELVPEPARGSASLPIAAPAREEAPARSNTPPRTETAARAAAPALADASLKDVTLTPQASTAPRSEPMSTALPSDRRELLSEIGCLFVERGRVAVSMLQRQYEMDFDAACKVLDDLQQMGLIGPYLGGQRRDILLTRDQWLAKVASV